MLILVLGGAASGKSAFAESLISAMPREGRVYLATMKLWDDECRRRADKHRAMRAGKGFFTVEQPENLGAAPVPPGSHVLLEDLSNLAANEYFGPDGPEGAEERILTGLFSLADRAENLVVVSNELFSDGMEYDPSTAAYLRLLARLNRAAAARAQQVYEVVCGIPVSWKEVQA